MYVFFWDIERDTELKSEVCSRASGIWFHMVNEIPYVEDSRIAFI